MELRKLLFPLSPLELKLVVQITMKALRNTYREGKCKNATVLSMNFPILAQVGEANKCIYELKENIFMLFFSAGQL